jgi:hypothetical protein
VLEWDVEMGTNARMRQNEFHQVSGYLPRFQGAETDPQRLRKRKEPAQKVNQARIAG